MTDHMQEFLNVINALNKYEVEYILVGGVAVIFHGLSRLTRDIDIFIKRNPENIEKLTQALYSVYKDTSINEITFSELEKYPVIRYGTTHGFSIDIMTRVGDVAGYEDLEHENIVYQGIQIRIATPETLYKLKNETIRDKDKADAMFLRDLIEKRKNLRE